MLTIKIKNDSTGTPETGNYDFEVWVNHDMIDFGHITNHERAKGWKELVRRIADYDSFDEMILQLQKDDKKEKLRKAAEDMVELYRTDPELNMDFCYGCDVKNNPKCDKCLGS